MAGAAWVVSIAGGCNIGYRKNLKLKINCQFLTPIYREEKRKVKRLKNGWMHVSVKHTDSFYLNYL